MTPLTYSYDKLTDTATINGAKFSGELLRFFGSDPPIGTLFRVVFSGDKTIGIERVDETLAYDVK